MNPRQRRGVFLMILSAVAAIVVFLGISTYVARVNSTVGPMVTVYRTTKDLPAFTTLSGDNTEPAQVPQRWAADNTVLKSADIDGRVIAVPMSAGSPVSLDTLVPASDLGSNQREMAVDVDAVSGLAGRIRPGDRVDMYAVFADVAGLPKQSRLLVENVQVVSVAGQQQVQAPDAKTLQNIIPVTLAVQATDALKVSYANSFAQKVFLVGLPAGVAQDRSKEQKTFDARGLGGTAVPEKGNQ